MVASAENLVLSFVGIPGRDPYADAGVKLAGLSPFEQDRVLDRAVASGDVDGLIRLLAALEVMDRGPQLGGFFSSILKKVKKAVSGAVEFVKDNKETILSVGAVAAGAFGFPAVAAGIGTVGGMFGGEVTAVAPQQPQAVQAGSAGGSSLLPLAVGGALLMVMMK